MPLIPKSGIILNRRTGARHYYSKGTIFMTRPRTNSTRKVFGSRESNCVVLLNVSVILLSSGSLVCRLITANGSAFFSLDLVEKRASCQLCFVGRHPNDNLAIQNVLFCLLRKVFRMRLHFFDN